MTQKEFNQMLQVAISQGLPGGYYTMKYSGEEVEALLDDGIFKIIGYFDTLEDLQEAHPSPSPGEAYGVGTVPPYHIYVYDSETQTWKDNGVLQGPKGDPGATGPQGAPGPKGDPGTSVDRVERTDGSGSAGTRDTYTMYDSDNSIIGTFQVYNGANGNGSGDFMANGSVPMSGTLQMNGNIISGLSEPQNESDAVPKSFLGKQIGGLTAANIPMSADDPTTVATELAGKAPDGFGLGSSVDAGGMQTVDSAGLDAIRVNGWVYFSDPDNPLADPIRTAIVRTDTSGRTMYQTAYPFSSLPYRNCKLMRTLMDTIGSGDMAIWTPWEWVNPPLALGAEYRTTERYLGKPVYVKLVDFGALPNNSTKLVEYAGGDNTTRIIEAHGVTSGGFVIPGSTGSSGYPDQVLDIVTNNNQVGVITHMDRSSYTAQFAVKYWRTSD